MQRNEGLIIGRTRGQIGESGSGLGQFQRHIYLLSIMGLCGCLELFKRKSNRLGNKSSLWDDYFKSFSLWILSLHRIMLNIKRDCYNFYHSGFQRAKINLAV